jgi:prevent-host-death family protein
MEIINIHEAKTHFSKLLARVQSGEEIIIAKAGKPYAKIVPLQQPLKRVPGIANGQLTDVFFDPLPEDELQEWE